MTGCFVRLSTLGWVLKKSKKRSNLSHEKRSERMENSVRENAGRYHCRTVPTGEEPTENTPGIPLFSLGLEELN